MSFTPDIPTTEDALLVALSSTLPSLPPQEQHLASTTVSWWETSPGEVYIHAEGGTADDRHYASTLVGLELEPHGYRRAQFDMDEPFAPIEPVALLGKTAILGKGRDVEHLDVGRYTSERTAAWPDLMAKAKRLLMSGQVHVLRNGYSNIVGHVIGDHGEYDTEISRDDPSSRSITGWQCSCPWDQYAWQRTRKWKKFEGRPCSHVMALYWKGLSTPLDEQLNEQQAQGMGTGQKIGPGAPAAPDTHEFGLPHSFGPEGEINQGDQQKLNLPPEALGGPPGPAQAPLAPPPSGPQPPGILPPFPGEQMEMQWAGPGTTPGGGKSPPGAYTVPGAKPQTPANPLQNPSTYSKMAGYEPDPDAPEEGEWVREPDDSGTYPQGIATGWRQAHARLLNDALHSWKGWGTDMRLHWDLPSSEAGLGHKMNAQAKALRWELENNARSNDVPLYRGSHEAPRGLASWSEDPKTARWWAKRNNGQVHTAQPGELTGLRIADYGNTGSLNEIEREWIVNHDPKVEGGRLASADFNAPEVVRLKNPALGLAEGPVQGQHGDGEYREVPAGTKGEVLSQDPTTGWIEAIFALDDSGPHEPFHVRVYLEPGDVERTEQTNAFIQRHSRESLD